MENNSPDKTIAMEARAASAEKLFSPSAARNSEAIANVLNPHLIAGARVLEIGSGTGEHGETVCNKRHDIQWTPSDPDATSRQSQAARAQEIGAMQSPLDIDVSKPGWAKQHSKIDVVVCCNVIHISPWVTAQGLAEGAAEILTPEGRIFLYGPFLEGQDSAPSNLVFDANLKSRNPEWGVRQLEQVIALFAGQGFQLEDRIDMPACNLSLIFRRSGE